jgi:hypothetical protein
MSAPTVEEGVNRSQENGRNRRLKTMSLAVTVCVDLVAGYVAWTLVRPGESLLWPTVIVALIMSAPAIAWYILIRSAGGWKSHHALTFSIVALCVAPIIWSFVGVLPASVGFNSTAVNWIHTSIQEGTQGCRTVSTGSVGFLTAPYKVCVTQFGTNSIVRFSTVDVSRGYAYVQGKTNLNWFPDQCATQLVLPHWWAFYSNSVQNVSGCPFGYWPHGGG